MLGVEAKRNQLMKSLEEHPLVKAALVVDEVGAVKSRIGSARSLIRNAAGSTTELRATGNHPVASLKENIYLVGAGGDFLIVIFDDGVDFDHVKRDVDGLLADLEL